MRTKDGTDFAIGMMLYMATGGRIVEMATRGMGYTDDSICVGVMTFSPIRLWHARYENAAAEAIEQLRTQITDLQQDIGSLQREISRRTQKSTNESRRRGRDSQLLRGDPLADERRVSRRTITVAVE